MKFTITEQHTPTTATIQMPHWCHALESDFPNGKLKICDLCCDDLAYVLYKKNGFYIQLNNHPLTEAHLLINPISHIYSFAILNETELNELDTLHQQVRSLLQKEYAAKGLDVIFFEHGSTISEEKKVSISGGSITHAHLQAIVVPKTFDFMAAAKESMGNLEGLEIIEIKKLTDLANRSIVPTLSSYLFIENVDGRMWVIIIKDTRCLPSMFLLTVIANKIGVSELGIWKVLSDSMRSTYGSLLDQARKQLTQAFKTTFADEEINKRNSGLISLESIRLKTISIVYLGSSSKRLLDIKKLLNLLIEDIQETLAPINGNETLNFKTILAEKHANKGGFNQGIILCRPATADNSPNCKLVRDAVITLNQITDSTITFHHATHHELWNHLLLKIRGQIRAAQVANINRNKAVLIDKLIDMVEASRTMLQVIETYTENRLN